jgi:FkbM family methyltransferase
MSKGFSARRLVAKGKARVWDSTQPLRQRIHRVSSGRREANAMRPFYAGQPDCQIPHLAWMYERFLGRQEQGQFVEVGAFDGKFVSNSWGLAERGWDGVMAEPQHDAWRKCVINHSNHPRVRVEQVAVGEPGVESIELFHAGALTTANQSLREEYEKVDWSVGHLRGSSEIVPCVTLDDFCEEQGVRSGFEVLIVDVEGFEANVFRGFTLECWNPKMIIIELADMHPDLGSTATTDAHLLLQIQNAGYQVAYKDHVNTVLVRIDVWTDVFNL